MVVTDAEIAHVDRELVGVDVGRRHGILRGHELPVAGVPSWLALRSEAVMRQGKAVMRRGKDKEAYGTD